MTCQRLYYDGKLSPNEKNPWAIFSQLSEMTWAQKLEFHKKKKLMIEHEFHTYGLDAIDPSARDKFKEFYNDELTQMTEELKKETESLNANKKPATGNKSKPATIIEDCDSTGDEVNGRTIDNSGLTKNANFSEMTKVDNPKIAKAKATPKRKVKGMFCESERSESEQEIPQAKANRGRKRSMESVESTPRSTPRSSPSPSTRSASRIPPSNTSRKGGNSGIFSDLTEESEQEVTQLSGRGKKIVFLIGYSIIVLFL